MRPRPRNEERGDCRRDWVSAEPKARDDAEVAAATAAQRPVEILVALTAGGSQPPVGGNDLRAQEVVGRQPELAAGKAHPTAERVPGDADRRTRSRWDR